MKCDYKLPEPPSGFPLATESVSPLPSRSLRSGNQAKQSLAPPPGASSRHQSPLPDIDTTDFKLLHHFTTLTYLTLSDQVELQDLWQRKIPELAFSHTFLLRVIFAISALHLYRTTSEPNYLSYALKKYQEALQSSSTVLLAISPSNCHALYACAALGFLFEFGASNNSESLLYVNDGSLAPWVIHVRGVRIIIGSSWHDLQSGTMGLLFHHEIDQEGVEGFEDTISRLEAHIRSIGVHAELLSTYLISIHELVKCSKMVGVGFFAWVCNTSDYFANLLAVKDPFALVIFAHSCVLLKYGKPRYWIEGWARCLLHEVHGYLDSSIGMWLEWPLTKVD